MELIRHKDGSIVSIIKISEVVVSPHPRIYASDEPPEL